MILQRRHPHDTSFKQRLIIAVGTAVIITFLLIFLQPFDTFQSHLPWKNVKLSGYALIVMICYLAIHPIDLLIKKSKQWTVGNEVTVLLLFSLLSLGATYAYHNAVFDGPDMTLQNFWGFSFQFSLPFLILMIVFIGYVRFRFGQLALSINVVDASVISLTNNTQTESFSFHPDTLLYVEASQNYITIYYSDNEDKVQQIVLRNTLSYVASTVSFVSYCHRSFLVNMTQVKNMKGNKRKARLTFKLPEVEVPVSQHYYDAIKSYLQDRPS